MATTLIDATKRIVRRADGVTFPLDRIVPVVKIPGLSITVAYRPNPALDASSLPVTR